jgi:hypothetical protein
LVSIILALAKVECQHAAPADNPRVESAGSIGNAKGMVAPSTRRTQPKQVRSERRQRQAMLAARVSPDEERRIREAAKARNVSIASLIRNAVLAAVEESPAA